MTVGLYAGTFDPITNGHLWMIKEAASLFDKVVVVVADNPEKRGTVKFDLNERVGMVKQSIDQVSGLTVLPYAEEFSPEYTVSLALSVGATHVVRGIRNEADFCHEQAIRHVNQDICPQIKTVFMIPPRHIAEISSSMVKSLVGFRGWRDVISRYVQPCVVKMFQADRMGPSEVMLRLGASLQDAVSARTYLEKAYGKMGYHTDCHIRECLKLMRHLTYDPAISPQSFDEMAAAIWFHDAVYDPRKNTNEKHSSAEFFGRFSCSIHSQTVQNVEDMILATRDHVSGMVNYPAELVSDIDMAILGAEEKEFRAYESGIRFEYMHVPPETFYSVRGGFLRKWLEDGVFHTKLFKDMLGEKAKANLSRLLATKEYSQG